MAMTTETRFDRYRFAPWSSEEEREKSVSPSTAGSRLK
jgi:hypothetical protein